MSPLQSFIERAEDVRRSVLDGKIPPHYTIQFSAEEIAAVSEKLATDHATLETANREVSDAIKKLENLYSLL